MSAKSKASKSDNVVALVPSSKRTSFQILSSSVATLRAEAAVSTERWKRRTKKLRKEIAALKEQKAALADLLTKKLVEQARAKATPQRITPEQSLKIASGKRGKRGSNKAKIFRASFKKATEEVVGEIGARVADPLLKGGKWETRTPLDAALEAYVIFDGKSMTFEEAVRVGAVRLKNAEYVTATETHTAKLQATSSKQQVLPTDPGKVAYAALDTLFTGNVIQDADVSLGPVSIDDRVAALDAVFKDTGRRYPRKLSHPELWNEVATQHPTLTESQINKRVADRSRSKRNRKQG